MGLRRVLLVLAASAAIAVSGCAGHAGSGVGAPIGVITSSAAAEELTGTVADGVEPGCLVLTGPQGHHVLVFDDPAVRSRVSVGVPVTVSGRDLTGQATTCMQGVPFLVTAVRAE
jgi:hypothetical protein